MANTILKTRLWLGSKLVGLGFLVAPDAYWTMFEGQILAVQLKRSTIPSPEDK